MTSNCFFFNRIDLQSPYIFLEGEEHHHLSHVSRIKPKEKVWLFDGQGKSYLAIVEEIRKEKTKLFIIEEKIRKKAKTKITLAQALIKLKNMEFIIQKSTELGVTTFLPVTTNRSMVKIEGKIENRLKRWKKIAREAVKQCRSSWIPYISLPFSLEELIKKKEAERKFLLCENRGEYLRDILLKNVKSQRKKSPSSVLILVGPEGGWTKEEEEYILSHGFEAISLGKNILRAETAALCSLALISHFWNL